MMRIWISCCMVIAFTLANVLSPQPEPEGTFPEQYAYDGYFRVEFDDRANPTKDGDTLRDVTIIMPWGETVRPKNGVRLLGYDSPEKRIAEQRTRADAAQRALDELIDQS